MYNIQFAKRSSKILHLRWKGGVGLRCVQIEASSGPSSFNGDPAWRSTWRASERPRTSSQSNVTYSSFTLHPTSSSPLKLSFCEMWNRIKRQLLTVIENPSRRFFASLINGLVRNGLLDITAGRRVTLQARLHAIYTSTLFICAIQ